MVSRVFIVCIVFCSMIMNLDAKLPLTQGEYNNGGADICNKPDLPGLCVQHFGAECTGQCENVWVRFFNDDSNKNDILVCRKNSVVQGCLYNNKGTVGKTGWVDGNECA